MMMDQSVNRQLEAITSSDLGLEEWPGARDNPAVVQMFKDVGHAEVMHDSTPWCAAYVGSTLAKVGLPHSGALNARSYATWGIPVTLAHAVPFDVCVFWRGSRDGWEGHVAFFLRVEGDRVWVRGGNQGDKVSDAAYPISRLLAIRRWGGGDTAPASDRPTLRAGNSAPDPFVQVAQEMLHNRGYFSGKIDGLFGPRTRASVLALQADAGLTVDGVIGPQTWEALVYQPETRPEREVTGDELLAAGSRTVQTARDGKAVTKGLTAAAAGGWVLANADQLGPKLDATSGLLDRLQSILSQYWMIFLVACLGLAAWWIFQRFEAIRVNDARTGANTRR